MISKFNEFNIHEVCREYGIRNYTISNGLVDVDGDVDLSGKQLDRLPLNFGKVTGDFYCSHTNLTTLEGAPKWVGVDFDCSFNNLTSLQGAPQQVGINFICNHNNLISLEGGPKEVGGSFVCYNNQLTTLQGAPKEIGRDVYYRSNPLPKEILGLGDIKYILKWQDDYSIWRKDGSLDLFRFQELIKD